MKLYEDEIFRTMVPDFSSFGARLIKPDSEIHNQTQRGSPSCSSSLARFKTPGVASEADTLLVRADEEKLLLFAVSTGGGGING